MSPCVNPFWLLVSPAHLGRAPPQHPEPGRTKQEYGAPVDVGPQPDADGSGTASVIACEPWRPWPPAGTPRADQRLGQHESSDRALAEDQDRQTRKRQASDGDDVRVRAL